MSSLASTIVTRSGLWTLDSGLWSRRSPHPDLEPDPGVPLPVASYQSLSHPGPAGSGWWIEGGQSRQGMKGSTVVRQHGPGILEPFANTTPELTKVAAGMLDDRGMCHFVLFSSSLHYLPCLRAQDGNYSTVYAPGSSSWESEASRARTQCLS